VERGRKRKPLWDSDCNSRERVKPFQVGWAKREVWRTNTYLGFSRFLS